MAIDTNADFTPSIPDSGIQPTKLPYNPTGSFKFWAQKVIPLVYDDSLSYYEVLCKVVNYLNDVIQNVDNLNDSVDSTNQSFAGLEEYVNTTKDTLIETYNELQEYVNTYFDNLDVQSEINQKLDDMADSGELGTILDPYISDTVQDWLTAHVTPVGSAVIVDNTLTVSGAAADARVTGVRLGNSVHGAGASNMSASDFITTYSSANTAPKQTIISVLRGTDGLDLTSYGFPENKSGILSTFSKTSATENYNGTYQFYFTNENVFWYRYNYSGSYTRWLKIFNRDIEEGAVIGSGVHINSSAGMVAPYDDLDTVPLNTIITYNQVYPTNAPSEITSGGMQVLTFSRNNQRSGNTALTTQFVFNRSNTEMAKCFYVRVSWQTSATMPWSAWKKITYDDHISLDLQEAWEKSGCNYVVIDEPLSTTCRELTFESKANGEFVINGTVTSASNAHRVYTTNRNIGDRTYIKTFKVKAGKSYMFGYEYVSGTCSSENYLITITGSPSIGSVTCMPNEFDTNIVFRPSVDSTIEFRVFAQPSAVFSNYTIRPYLVALPDNPVSITPSMFSKIGVIGDSFASGISGEEGEAYEYSWLQMMARQYGCTGHNFSSGGFTTRTWLTGTTKGKGKLENTEACNIYFIALGINDSNPDSRNVPLGTIADMDSADPPDTFYGNMKRIRDVILTKNENAVLCYITPQRIGTRYIPYQDAVVAIAQKYGCLLIDWRNVVFNQSTWWMSNLINQHPRVAMYNAMMNSIVEELRDAMMNNMSYIQPYPNIVNS